MISKINFLFGNSWFDFKINIFDKGSKNKIRVRCQFFNHILIDDFLNQQFLIT